MRRFAVSSVALACLAWSACAAAQDYEIKLTRPTRPGARYHLDATGTLRERQTTISGGKTNQTAGEYQIELSGQAEVLETDARNREIRTAVLIEKCVRRSGQSRLDLLPAGQTLIATSTNGQTAFALQDGATLLPRDNELMRLIIPLATGGPDDDELFGTPERKRPGSAWPVNAAAMARDMREKQMEIDPAGITGTTRLVRVTQAAGQDCLEVRSEIKIRKVTPPLAAGTKLTRCEINASFGGLFPIQTQRGRVSEFAELTMNLAFTGQTGPQKLPVSVETTQERKAERKFRYADE